MKNLYYWLAICIGYCFGSVLYGYEIPRIVKKINICELSDDGNPGTYNAFRYGGFICGISVLIAELLKGFIPVFFSAKYIGRESVLFAFVMAAPVMGHAFSVYYFYMKFRMKYINREKNMPRYLQTEIQAARQLRFHLVSCWGFILTQCRLRFLLHVICSFL